MRKTEFLRRVRAAKKDLRTKHYSPYYPFSSSLRGVCEHIKSQFGSHLSVIIDIRDNKYFKESNCFSIQSSFNHFFGPHLIKGDFWEASKIIGFDGSSSYWLGDLTEKNIERREFYLEMWAQWMITFEHYKKIRSYPFTY